MFDREIKVDTIIRRKKKDEKTTPKSRTVLFQWGGDDVNIATKYLIPARRAHTVHSASVNGANQERAASLSELDSGKVQFISVGNIAIKIVAPDEVKPTFMTPCVNSVMLDTN